MTFKKYEEQEQEAPKKKGMSNELYDKFIDLIQMEIDKLTFVSSAKYFFYNNGQMNYKKFFKHLYKCCEEMKCCMLGFLNSQMEDIPEFKIPAIENIDSVEDAFNKMAEYEDLFVEKLNDAVTQALNDQNWAAFYYLLEKFKGIDHLCCRAAAAIKNKEDVLQLLPCEQHTSEK